MPKGETWQLVTDRGGNEQKKSVYAVYAFKVFIHWQTRTLRDSTAVKGVALNVDFMEELSQAVRLVREDWHCSSFTNAMPHSA